MEFRLGVVEGKISELEVSIEEFIEMKRKIWEKGKIRRIKIEGLINY